MSDLLQLSVSGLAAGSIYALVALGMTVIYRATTVLNFAHGELFALGGFFALVLMSWVPYGVALVLAVLATFVVGVAVDKATFEPLLNAGHLPQVFATVAVLFIFKGTIRFFQPEPRPMEPILDTRSVEVMGSFINPQHLFIIGTMLVAATGFALVFTRTHLGRIMRASTESLRGCAMVGINLKRVFAMMWGFGAALGGLAGVFAAPVLLVSADSGVRPLTMALAGMTFGGFGTFSGAVVGSLLLGLVEVLAAFYVSSTLGDAAGFIVVFLILVVRPRGLFSAKGAVA